MAFNDDAEERRQQQEEENEQIQQEFEEQMEAMRQKRLKDVKSLKSQLKAIYNNQNNLKNLFDIKPELSAHEQKVVKKAKRYRELRKEVKAIEDLIEVKKLQRDAKGMSATPILVWIGIFGLMLFLVIAVVSAIGSIMSWLFPGEDGESEGGANAAFGITGVDFYGARMVYTDENKATAQTIEDYVSILAETESEIEKISTVTTAGGSTYNVVVQLEITLPDANFDYVNFDEANFTGMYTATYNLIKEIAKDTYKVDNGSDFSGTSLIECVKGIKYFGIGNPESAKTSISNFVLDTTNVVLTFTATDTSGNPVDSTASTEIKTQLETLATEVVESEVDENSIRTEKLFVKDYILEGDDAMMSGITKENYVAMIFMPKKNVQFTQFSFSVGDANLSSFTIDVNGNTLSNDGNNLGSEEKQAYIYGDSLNISATKFGDIDSSNLKALSKGMSLLDIVKTLNKDTYLESKTTEGEKPITYYALKKNGVVVNLFNTEPFMFVEYETGWQS